MDNIEVDLSKVEGKVTLELSPTAAYVLYRVVATAPRNGLDDEAVKVIHEKLIDGLGMREAVDKVRAERAKAREEAAASTKRRRKKEEATPPKESGDLNPVEMVKRGAA